LLHSQAKEKWRESRKEVLGHSNPTDNRFSKQWIDLSSSLVQHSKQQNNFGSFFSMKESQRE
jgi:hypothetical protein